jgi:predicted dehydrogenase
MVKVIHAGLGNMGRAWIRMALNTNRRVRVVGLADVDRKALAAARELLGDPNLPGFTSPAEALRQVEADLLLCATPPESHGPTSVAAMRAGLDVICEKPMASTPAECRAMLKTAETTGRRCVIAQNYRHNPLTRTLARIVGRGDIGEVGQVRIDFQKGVPFDGFRREMDDPLLVDMSIHHFDLIRFITGLDAVAVRGEAWNPPWSHYRGNCSDNLTFEMNNGARVVYTGSWCAKGDHCDWNANWLIEGTTGALEYRNGEITLHSAPELYKTVRKRTIRRRKMRLTGQAYILGDYLRVRRAGEHSGTDVRDNIRSINMVFAAVKAVRTGRRITIAGT